MQRSIRVVVKHTSHKARAISDATHKSKNLFNYANYITRQHFFNTGKLLGAYRIIPQLVKENQVDYRALPARISAQVIMQVERAWKCYFKALRAYKNDPSVFIRKPRMPKYKEKDGHNIITIAEPNIKGSTLHLPKQLQVKPIKFQKLENSTIKQVRIIPQTACFIVEFIYETSQGKAIDCIDGSFLSIDLGLNNFITALDNQGNTPFIIKGGVVKSINQGYNKRRAKLAQIDEKSNKRHSTKQIQRITMKRNHAIKNFMHHASAYIAEFCKANKIQSVIIGRNLYWKQNIALSKRTNQNFVGIPYFDFVCKLSYKLDAIGVKLVETDESYTSKCDHLAYETMEHHEKYLGKRVKRGLFKSSTGAVINADVNGALGIARKVIGDSVIAQIVDRGGGLTPLKINVLKPRDCGGEHLKFKKVS